MLAMPRFDDGAIDMQELLRRPTEQVVDAVMDAEADQLCGGGGLPGGCSYSFVNWEMLSVRPNRGMLTPSH